jgi:hypothetical protein
MGSSRGAMMICCSYPRYQLSDFFGDIFPAGDESPEFTAPGGIGL